MRKLYIVVMAAMFGFMACGKSAGAPDAGQQDAADAVDSSNEKDGESVGDAGPTPHPATADATSPAPADPAPAGGAADSTPPDATSTDATEDGAGEGVVPALTAPHQPASR